MKTILLTLLCLPVCLMSSAQNTSGTGYQDQLSNNNSIFVRSTKRKVIDIEGSPYITEKFQPVKISGQEQMDLKGRYNAYNGDMEILDVTKGTTFVLNKNLTTYDVEFIAEHKSYRSYSHQSNDGSIANGFFVTLTKTNNMVLLKQENIKFLKEKKAVSTYDRARPATYKRDKDAYFIQLNSKPAVEFPTKKRDISKLFPKNSKKILGHIKSNRLNLKEETDLIKLINYISGL